MIDIFIVLPGADGEDIAATVTVYESHDISPVDMANGCLDGTAGTDDVERPDTLVEGGQHRVLKQREKGEKRERERERGGGGIKRRGGVEDHVQALYMYMNLQYFVQRFM